MAFWSTVCGLVPLCPGCAYPLEGFVCWFVFTVISKM